MKNLNKKLITSLALGLMISTSSYAEQNKMPPPKADIYVVPQPSNMVVELKYPATIKPYQSVDVYARVTGVLEKMHIDEGSDIKKGQLLFDIEDDIYQAEFDTQLSNVEMQKATYENAQRDWKRIKTLHEQKVVTDEQRDATLFSYKKAQANLTLAKSQLKQAQISLNYTKVKSPIDGTLGLKKIDVGNLVSSNPPTALISITNNNKLYLDFSMPMSDYKNIQSGQWSIESNKDISISVLVRGNLLKNIGHIDYRDININQKTSTVKMRAIVDNKAKKIMAGDFVRVILDGIIQKDVITIPQRALLQNPKGSVVFVDENGVAGVRPVMIGKERGDKYTIVGGMLKSGDRVIVNNFFKVKPGQPFQVDKIINK
jgi:membrane fusion protein (multidrug efflux system)